MCTAEFNFGNKQVYLLSRSHNSICCCAHSKPTRTTDANTHTQATAAAFSQFSFLTIFHSSYFAALSQSQQQQEQAQQQ